MDEIVTQLVDRLGSRLREEFEERAAIVEFDGGRSRELAEALALLDVLRRHPGVLAGVMVVEVEVEGDPVWLLATDREGARRVADHCGDKARFVDLVELIECHFGGGAMFTTLRTEG